MALRLPDTSVGPYREKNSIVLHAVLMDNASPPAVIPGTALVSATLTLYLERAPNSIINGRDHVDIKPNVNGQGVLTFPLSAADMAIIVAQPEEYHRALIEWVWNVDQRGSYEIQIRVQDVNLVT